jgi:predicted phage tail protein
MRTSLSTFAAALAAAAALALAGAPLAFAQTAPTCVQGKVGVAPAATITFTAPTTNTDGTPIATPLTYEIFEGTASGAETLAAKGLAGSPIAVNTGLKDGTTVYFYVEAVDANGAASAPSNEVCKSFPAGVPSSVTITIT